MLGSKQIARMLLKLSRLENELESRMFQKVAELPVSCYETSERLHKIPGEALFKPCKPGDTWGGEGRCCWFRGSYTPPAELSGKPLFLWPRITGYEALLFVDGAPFGLFASKYIVNSHGSHYCDMLVKEAVPGKRIDIALEYYAGHYVIGTKPFETRERTNFEHTVGTVDICLKDDEIIDFLFDLRTLNQLAAVLGEDDFRRAEVVNALTRVHEIVWYSPEDAGEDAFRESLRAAAPYLKKTLARRNSKSAPTAGIIGHSHMDTAWLWTVPETVKKCARTYANQISLMEQYPEYLFVQSSACHSDMIREHYPDLFAKIKERVAEGRYEPNGGVWVECDCNLVSGEMMARQFLWGQRFTLEHFDYLADTFWLPDTFGYSAAIPQIMKLSGVKYFLTTKMAWNDTNDFPYDTFYWKGVDGTKALTHLNKTHIKPDPEALVNYVVRNPRNGDNIKEKTVSNMRLLSFGYGDGGGGPEFEMLESARRVEDLEGLPRARYMTVSDFMQTLERTIVNPSTYSGELYLELHRGTLTNQHTIKRNNRLAEIAIHDLEYITVRHALARSEIADGAQIRPLVGTLLINQFHDILPGTCIPEAHEQSKAETGRLIADARALTAKLAKELTSGLAAGPAKSAAAGDCSGAEGARGDFLTALNTLSFERGDVFYVDAAPGTRLDGAQLGGARQQAVGTLFGDKLAVAGLTLPAFGAVPLMWGKEAHGAQPPARNTEASGGAGVSPFRVNKKRLDALETPFASVTFDREGYIRSFRDKTENGRELCGEGYPLNTFLIAEDVPAAWDNWDVDADTELRYRPVKELVSREVVADGAVEFRIRSVYRISEKSKITQDIVFYADTPLVRFETRMDWHENHRFLKTAFDTSIAAAEARHEIQFGHIKRSTARNTDLDKAKFEVSNHKFTDLSETRYGVAILNDCKYGVSVSEGQIRLSLHKGGNRPDYAGDHGVHDCAYAFLPHRGGFSAKSVVHAAYAFNYPPLIVGGADIGSPAPNDAAPNSAVPGSAVPPLLAIDSDAVLVETVKPCEDEDRAFILRLYECEGSHPFTKLSVPGAKAIVETNLLEVPLEEPDAPLATDQIELEFRPFEIKTLRVDY
ncbi:MAG: glycosyl hydrolase-related protein [Clostridiales bacterium]|jgi:alpha-mannosidase|nr:glycosyl hydrolase-related protein [Clostridiales bacterium]